MVFGQQLNLFNLDPDIIGKEVYKKLLTKKVVR